MNYSLVLGLEIHLQISTDQKMFCACLNKPFGSSPNTHVCPVCLGLPGALPVPNGDALEKAQKMAFIAGTKLRTGVLFERKNYFYPDLPKGYQITTPHYPIGEGGKYVMLFDPSGVEIAGKSSPVRWREIHIEEDTAKSMHRTKKTWIDFNKSGVPLLEMVTEPDFISVDQAVQFCKEMQWLARYLEVSDADMEKGQMRLEANISLRTKKEKDQGILPGYRVELKNINSFTFMKKAVEAEIARQSSALEQGKKLTQETRGYDENTKKTFSQRGKEDAHDYRYFPEPDIPPVMLNSIKLGKKTSSPRLVLSILKEAGVRDSYLQVIVSDRSRAEYTLEALRHGEKRSILADTIAGEIVNKKLDPKKATAHDLVSRIVRDQSAVVSDDKQLAEWIDTALSEHPDAVDAIRGGKVQAVGALIGSVMKKSKGTADARKVTELIQKKLQ